MTQDAPMTPIGDLRPGTVRMRPLPVVFGLDRTRDRESGREHSSQVDSTVSAAMVAEAP